MGLEPIYLDSQSSASTCLASKGITLIMQSPTVGFEPTSPPLVVFILLNYVGYAYTAIHIYYRIHIWHWYTHWHVCGNKPNLCSIEVSNLVLRLIKTTLHLKAYGADNKRVLGIEPTGAYPLSLHHWLVAVTPSNLNPHMDLFNLPTSLKE